jgi:hypothetical protein
MPLRYVAGRGWRGPRAVILAEKRRAHKTMFRRSNRGKSVRRGSGEPYRRSYFGVSPCAHIHALSQPAWRQCTCGLVPSRGILCRCDHCSSHEDHSSEIEGVEPKSHLCRIPALLHQKRVGSARRGQHGPELLDFSHIFCLTIRAKESGRCLGLKSSSCEMTWRRRILPAAPCRLGLLLAFLLGTVVKVSCRAFGCRGQGPAGKRSGASLLN